MKKKSSQKEIDKVFLELFFSSCAFSKKIQFHCSTRFLLIVLRFQLRRWSRELRASHRIMQVRSHYDSCKCWTLSDLNEFLVDWKNWMIWMRFRVANERFYRMRQLRELLMFDSTWNIEKLRLDSQRILHAAKHKSFLHLLLKSLSDCFSPIC